MAVPTVEPRPVQRRDEAAAPGAPSADDAEFAAILQLAEHPHPDSETQMRSRLARAEAAGQPWHLHYLQVALGRVLSIKSPEAALPLGQAALAGMRALGSRDGEAKALNVIALATRESGDLAECLLALEKALEIQRELGDLPEMARTLANLSVPLERVGRRDAALQCLEDAVELLRDTPHRLRLVTQNNAAGALAARARSERDEGLPRALWRPHAERAIVLAQALLQNPLEELSAALNHPRYPQGCMARALVVLDRLDEALPLLLELQAIYRADDNTYALLYVQLDLARAWLQSGRPGEARATASEALARAEAQNFDNTIEDLNLVLSQACEAEQDFRAALAAFHAYHRMKMRGATERAEERARSLAVRLDTARAQRESRRDALTGLLNRRGFDEALARALNGDPHPAAEYDDPDGASQRPPLTLLVIDLDHFKAVNDRDGHARGDQALVLLAQLLQRHCRPQDQAARLGGDEFALLAQMSPEHAHGVAERVRQALRNDSLARWPARPPLTLSVGMSPLASPDTAEALLSRADAALYAAKAAGRDTVRSA